MISFGFIFGILYIYNIIYIQILIVCYSFLGSQLNKNIHEMHILGIA